MPAALIGHSFGEIAALCIGGAIQPEVALRVVAERFEALYIEVAAQRGRGATLNGRRLSVSTTDVLLNGLLATGFPYDRALMPRSLRQFGLFSTRSRAVRRLGSAALDSAYVAASRLDGYWEATICPWDIAAGWLMVLEAGGRVSDLGGNPFTFERGEVLATNGPLHPAMLGTLAEAEAGS